MRASCCLRHESAAGSPFFELLGDGFNAEFLVGVGFLVEHIKTTEQFLVVGRVLQRHAHEHVDVVGHDGVGEDVDAAEIGDLPDLFAEDFLCGIVEAALAVVVRDMQR